MSRRISRVKGTRDLLPPETAAWAAVEATARRVFGLYGYAEIRTPALETTELFVRTVGETTDIVGKEMYTFADRKGRSLTLRPESTAAVARAFVENGMASWPSPVKLFYIGSHFRYERPQRGRYRQFHQIGAELLGDASPEADAELVLMLWRFLSALGFADLTVLLNTVGDAPSRAAFAEALRAYLAPHAEVLCEDSRRRLAHNPLRILDTKDPRERQLLAVAPALEGFLSAASRSHFAAVRALLDRFGVAVQVAQRLVRGLDYYTGTVFEVVAQGLGAQDALVGGGRYDGLVAGLGGPEIPGIGFAIGEDRLLEVLPAPFRDAAAPPAPVLVVSVGEVPPAEAMAVGEEVRAAGLACVTEPGGRSLRAALRRADQQGIARVVLVGDEELAAGRVTLKDLRTGRQQAVARHALAAALQEAP